MKKIIIILLTVLFVLSGCSKKDPQAIYQEAYDNMAALDSFTMSQEASIVMGTDEGEMTIEYDTFIKVNGLDFYTLVNMSFLGIDYAIEEWILDGKAYINQDGEYYYQEGLETDISTYNNQLTIDCIESYAYQQSEGMDVVTLVISKEGIENAFSQLVEGQIGLSTLEGIEFSPLDVYINNGYIEKITFTYSAEIEGYKVKCTVLSTFSDHNNTTIAEPDYSLYEDYFYNDDDYSPSIDIENDITSADSDRLASLGYTSEYEDYFENQDGTIGLDVKWKVLYYMVDDKYIEYDWEYDLGTDFTDEDKYCSIDFETREIDESCTSEQSKLLYEVRGIFIDLYNAINQ